MAINAASRQLDEAGIIVGFLFIQTKVEWGVCLDRPLRPAVEDAGGQEILSRCPIMTALQFFVPAQLETASRFHALAPRIVVRFNERAQADEYTLRIVAANAAPCAKPVLVPLGADNVNDGVEEPALSGKAVVSTRYVKRYGRQDRTGDEKQIATLDGGNVSDAFLAAVLF